MNHSGRLIATLPFPLSGDPGRAHTTAGIFFVGFATERLQWFIPDERHLAPAVFAEKVREIRRFLLTGATGQFNLTANIFVSCPD